MEPIVARRLLEALDDVGRVARLFADRCVAGLTWREDVLARHLAGSLAPVVEQAASEGYDAAARAATPPAAGRP